MYYFFLNNISITEWGVHDSDPNMGKGCIVIYMVWMSEATELNDFPSTQFLHSMLTSTNKRKHILSVRVWVCLISLRIVNSNSIHYVANVRILFFFYVWVILLQDYTKPLLFMPLLVDGHLGWFSFLIVNPLAVNLRLWGLNLCMSWGAKSCSIHDFTSVVLCGHHCGNSFLLSCSYTMWCVYGFDSPEIITNVDCMLALCSVCSDSLHGQTALRQLRSIFIIYVSVNGHPS